MSIIIKSEREIAVMRQAGRILANVMEVLKSNLRPGMKTKELDKITAKELARRGAKASFKVLTCSCLSVVAFPICSS